MPFSGGRLFLLVIVALFLLIAPQSIVLGSDLVTLELHDSRTITGLIDARTDSTRLWIRRQIAAADLSSGFEWGQIHRIRAGGQLLDPSEYKTFAGKLASRGRTFAEIPTADRSGAAPTTKASFGKVQSLVVKAYLAQFDDDALSDGLRVFVWPLDNEGQITPVTGQIDLTLVTETEPIQVGKGGPARPRFSELERSTYLVKTEHFARGPAVYKLPFDKAHPDFDATIAWNGLVHARLGVPAQGVFEASDASVALRECSYFRDQLQHYTPARYLPLEAASASRN